MQKKFILSLAALLLSSSSLWAFSGTEGASFLDVPVGARPAALGSAYTALANDAYAPSYNPGGLGFLESPQASAMHLIYLQDTAFEYLSYVQPLTAGHSLGAAIQYFRPGTITGLDASGKSIGDVDGHYAAYSLAYGQQLWENFSLGITGKVIEAQIDDVSASAYAADIGAFYRAGSHLSVAAVADNLGNKLTFLQQADPLPRAERLGVAYHARRELTLSAEGAYRASGLSSFQAGSEWMSPEGFSFRAGYDTERIRGLSPMAGVSVGLGIAVWGDELAYTWAPVGALGSTHYISILARFGEQRRHYLQPSDSDMSFDERGSLEDLLSKDSSMGSL